MNELTPIKVNDMLAQIADWAIDSNAADAVLIAMRKLLLETALELENGNQCAVARRLGMHRNSISRIMDSLGIDRRQRKTAKHGQGGA